MIPHHIGTLHIYTYIFIYVWNLNQLIALRPTCHSRMAASSCVSDADLQEQNFELTKTILLLQKEITALKKSQFKQDILLKKLETSIKERDDRLEHCVLYIEDQNNHITRAKIHQILSAGTNKDSIEVNCIRVASGYVFGLDRTD